MKTIDVMLAGLCLLLCMSAVDVKAANEIKNKVKGRWEVTVPDAPLEYRRFILDIKEKNDTVVIDVKGGDVDIKEHKFAEKNGELSANLYVGEYVTVTIREEKGAIKGSALTSMGRLPCHFKKLEA
ncbi:MAG: hypothetical protein LBC19_14190, partial [Tannerella sp.]|nr:hypothetical protein [Tannerella sp.]